MLVVDGTLAADELGPHTGRQQDGVDRYWIDTESGLLCAAESSSEDRITYEMTEIQLTTPLAAGVTFTLPNGMVLHETS